MKPATKPDLSNRMTNSRPIPAIPLPSEQVMKDVLKVKPPTKTGDEETPIKKAN